MRKDVLNWLIKVIIGHNKSVNNNTEDIDVNQMICGDWTDGICKNTRMNKHTILKVVLIRNYYSNSAS